MNDTVKTEMIKQVSVDHRDKSASLSVKTIQTVLLLLSKLPHSLISRLVTCIFYIGYLLVPRMKKVAYKNLMIAFPESSDKWKKNVLARNAQVMGNLVADSLKVPQMSQSWVKSNVNYTSFISVMNQVSSHPVIVISAHIGSFELIPHIAGLLGYPMHSVVRPFHHPAFDKAWQNTRESHGSRVIPRAGATKKLKRLLSNNAIVGILCDQNITRKNAIFLPWFNTDAATTKMPGYLALDPLVKIVTVFNYREDNVFQFCTHLVDVDSIRENNDLSQDEKIREITKGIVKSIEAQIKLHPAEWFWIHRRWKTRPEGEPENFYN
jgi:KDO2-lipid IV(A) lauroyltransferase